MSAKAVGYRLRNGSNRHPANFYSSIARASFVVEGDLGSLVVTIDAFGFVKIVEIRFVT